MVILLFGAPGCGKGTQAELISERFHIPAISTGELLRSEVAVGSDLGLQVSTLLAAGSFVSDELVTEILLLRIQRRDCADGFLLDGYPRTLAQAKALDRFFVRYGIEPITLHIDVPEESIAARITARRQCPKCHHIYNLVSNPPQVADRCDFDGLALYCRSDDRAEVIRKRLEGYHEATGPAIDYYKNRNYHHVDGQKSPDHVFQQITAVLEPAFATTTR